MLTLDRAMEINSRHVKEPHLVTHALAVSSAMAAMAEHFGEDPEHWAAVGYLHDVDYEKFPEEHLSHTAELLEGENIEPEELRAILAHGWGICSEVEPVTNMEKSLYTVDELTGIISAASLMRPTGVSDLEVKSLMKKFKDKKFAAKCDRALIQKGCDMLGMSLQDVMQICINGMRDKMTELGIGPRE